MKEVKKAEEEEKKKLKKSRVEEKYKTIEKKIENQEAIRNEARKFNTMVRTMKYDNARKVHLSLPRADRAKTWKKKDFWRV